MKTNCSLRVAAVFLVLWSPWVVADDSTAVNHITLHDYETYHLKSDGRYTYEDDVIDQVKTSQGISAIGEKSIAFRSPMQRLDILEAYTETPRGKKIPVGANEIRVQESPISVAAPTFSDIKVETIIFPALEVG